MKPERFCLLLLIILINIQGVAANKMEAKVDERIELTSIICRLIGAKEYNLGQLAFYNDSIDNYFSAYMKHPALEAMLDSRKRYGIGYNIIPLAAMTLEIKNGKVSISKENTPEKLGLYPRWPKKNFEKFVALLNDFYQDTHFNAFFKSNAELYAQAETIYNTNALKNIHTEWFEKQFNEPFGERHIYLSLVNGKSNYAVLACNSIIVGGISYSPRATGLESGNKYRLKATPDTEMIVHEFAHTFINKYTDAYQKETDSTSSILYEDYGTLLLDAGYGPRAIFTEWVTNLITSLYLIENEDTTDTDYATTKAWNICLNHKKGFTWFDKSINFLEYYREKPELYPTFQSFLPQLVGFYNALGGIREQLKQEYEMRHPYMVNVYPAPNTSLDLTLDTVTIIITFSEPMHTNSSGINLLWKNDSSEYRISSTHYGYTYQWQDNTHFVLKMDPEYIKSKQIYGFQLNTPFFQNEKFEPLTGIDTVNYTLE